MLLNDDAPGMIDGVIAQSGGTLTSFVGYATGERNSVAVNQRISQLCAKFIGACDTTSLIADQINALRNDSKALKMCFLMSFQGKTDFFESLVKSS